MGIKHLWQSRISMSVLVVICSAITACSSPDDNASDTTTSVASTTVASSTTAPATTSTSTTVSTTSTTTSSTTTSTTLAAADPEAIVGNWDQRGGDVLSFEADGSYGVRIDLDDEPFDTGTYTFDGVTLVMTGAPGSDYCPDEVGTYTVTFQDEMTADVDVVDDPCGQRRTTITFGLSRHDPDS